MEQNGFASQTVSGNGKEDECVSVVSEDVRMNIVRLDWTEPDLKIKTHTKHNNKLIWNRQPNNETQTHYSHDLLNRRYDVTYASDVIYGGSDIAGLCSWVMRLTKGIHTCIHT